MKQNTAKKRKNKNNYTLKGGLNFFSNKGSPSDTHSPNKSLSQFLRTPKITPENITYNNAYSLDVSKHKIDETNAHTDTTAVGDTAVGDTADGDTAVGAAADNNNNSVPSTDKHITKLENLLRKLNDIIIQDKNGEINESIKNINENMIKLQNDPLLQNKKDLIRSIDDEISKIGAILTDLDRKTREARMIKMQMDALNFLIPTQNSLLAKPATNFLKKGGNNKNKKIQKGGGIIKNEANIILKSAGETYTKIKGYADYARTKLNEARQISMKARALALKSRGEAVVGFLKDAESNYKAKIKAQEKDMKVKGLAKKAGPTNISATKSPEFEIESKVFPLPFVNSKGYRIGDYQVYVNTDLLPFNGLDQANHFLYNLFDYVNYEGTPVDKNNKKDIQQFFNSTKHKFKAFTPIKYPDTSRTTFLEKQQMENEKEYKHLRERARLFMNELAEMGKDGDPAKRAELKSKIEQELVPIDALSISPEDIQRKKQVVLSEYLNAIDELEHGIRGDTTPLFNKALSKDNEGKVFIPINRGGGKKKKRKNNLICSQISKADSRNRSRVPSARRGKLFKSSQKKRKRKNKTLKNRKK